MSRALYRGLLWGPVLIIPLAFSRTTLDPVLPLRFILFSLFLIIAVILLAYPWKKNKIPPAGPLAKRWLVAFCLYLTVSAVSLLIKGVNPADGWFQWLNICLFGISVLVFYMLITLFPRFPECFSRAVIVLVCVCAIYGLYQFLTLLLPAGLTHQASYLLTSTFANKNIFAEILSVLLPFQIYGLFRLERPWKVAAAFTTVLSVFLIVMSLSRAAWVSLALGLFMAVFYLLLHSDRKAIGKILSVRTFILILLPLAVSAGSILLLEKKSGESVFRKQVHNLLHPGYGSTRDRLLLWEKTLEMSREDPVFGKGLGSWKIAVMEQGNEGLKSADNLTFYQRPHNDFLWILSEQGGIALLLFLLLAGMALLPLLRGRGEGGFEWRMAVFSATVIYLGLSMFAFPKERTEHVMFFSVFLACGLAAGDAARAAGPGRPALRPLPAALLLILPAAALVTGIIRFRSEGFTRKALLARDRQQWQQSLRYLDRANNPLYRFDPTTTPLSWYEGMAWYNLGEQDKALERFTDAWERCPWHPHVLNNLAGSYAIKGDNRQAVHFYSEAVRVSPHFDDACLNLAAVEYNSSHYTAAYKALRRVDTAFRSEQYPLYRDVILKDYLVFALDSLGNETLNRGAAPILGDPEWIRLVYYKSIREKRGLLHQLTLDVIWLFNNNQDKESVAIAEKLLPLLHENTH
ncbi:MAG TPA: O-antigen ligase family protein [Bacteroidales bacterium]|nr:O-antigen ligase family protein [Bacteroidales bacterium]HSA43673.1 O-antigen ligase family protein [Bacteroidales bacterium]